MSYANTAVLPDDSSQFLNESNWSTIKRPISTKININQSQHALNPNYKAAIRKTDESFKQLFRNHVERWVNDVKDISSFTDLVLHEDYKTISGLGPRAIPLLFRELRDRPHFWFDALRTLLQANEGIKVDPVEEEDRGNLQKMTASWLAWAVENDYI